MLSFDTNIAVYAANSASPWQQRAYDFLTSLGGRGDVAVCELMLVELYLKLRNEKIFPHPLSGEGRRGLQSLPRQSRVGARGLGPGDGGGLAHGSESALRVPANHRCAPGADANPSRRPRVCDRELEGLRRARFRARVEPPACRRRLKRRRTIEYGQSIVMTEMP